MQLDHLALATLVSDKLEIAQRVRDKHSYSKHKAISSKGLDRIQLDKARGRVDRLDERIHRTYAF